MSLFNCCTCPEPPNYEEGVDDPLPKYTNKCGCPTATLECVSEQKVATLCGFSEFTGDGVESSVPPNKYLKASGSGTASWPSSRPAVDCDATRSRRIFGTVVYDGCNEFSAETFGYENCNTYTGSWVSSGGATCSDLNYCGDTDWTEKRTSIPSNWTSVEFDCGAAATTTISNTVRNYLPNAVDAKPDFVCSDILGFNQIVLSEPDTEAASLARATATDGTACSSIYELRTTSLSFTVRTATYSVIANNLCKGRAYEGCVRLQRREAYSGTEPEGADTEWEDIEPDTIASFTATAKEMEIETDVALPGGTVDAIGYEYRAVSAHVWPVSAGCDCPTDYVAP